MKPQKNSEKNSGLQLTTKNLTKNLLFLGSPGVGKGTYAQVLKDELKIPHISTGDLLRDEAQKETSLSKKIKQTMNAGGLVSDNIMLELVKNRIMNSDCKKGFILDGYPRTPAQAQALDKITKGTSFGITHVIHFKADDSVIIDRLSTRIVCGKCKTIFNKKGNMPKVQGICDNCGAKLIQRDDDKPEAIKKRLELYRKETAPLIIFYKNKKIMFEITINKPISEIRKQVIIAVESIITGKKFKGTL